MCDIIELKMLMFSYNENIFTKLALSTGFEYNEQSDHLPFKPITCHNFSSIRNLTNHTVRYIFKAQSS